jgi:hypothetical protein
MLGSGRQSASIFFFISDQAPSCCLLDPVACLVLFRMLLERIMDGETESIDWFGEKQACLGVKHIEKKAGEGKRWTIG